MKNKAIIIASVCLLTTGGSAVYLTARPSSSSSPPAINVENSPYGPVTPSPMEPGTAMSGDPAKNSFNQRLRPVSDYQELEKKFGASRVRLTKSATDSFMKFSDAMAQILEYQLSQRGKEAGEGSMASMFDPVADPLESVTGLILSAEQKVQVEAIQANQIKKTIEAARTMQSRLSKNRIEVMEMMLCSEAANRGEMSKGDYQAMLDGKEKELLFIDDMLPEADTIQNQVYRTELPSILDSDQMALFEEFRSAQEVEAKKHPVDQKIVGPLGIWRTSDGPKPESFTLEQYDENLKKMATATTGMLEVIEATRGK